MLRFRTTLCLLTTAPLAILPPGLRANLPVGPQVVHGNVAIAQTGAHLTIDQASRHAIVNWQSFNIGAGNSLRLQQTGADAAMLARVIGGDPSKLLGSLQADGQLFLINPKGVVIGADAVIDTAAFTASTLDVSDADFLRGAEMTFKGASDAGIVNLGRITAREGSVMLFAHTVKNAGAISAPKGTAALAAASEVYLASPEGSSVVVKFNLPKSTARTGVENTGVIEAAQAELKAAGGSIYDLAVNHAGIVRVTGFERRDGRVILTADGGSVEVSGNVKAQNADGSGGEIFVGGDFRGGQGAAGLQPASDEAGRMPAVLPNADRTVVTETVHLDASAANPIRNPESATRNSSAGRAIVWADDTTTFLGRITASGDQGGFAEVSGKRFLDFRPASTFDLGRGGTLLLDPDELVVADVDPGTAVSFMSVATLESQLAASNVTLDTSHSAGDVQFNSPVAWATANRLQVNAGGSIFLNSDITATHADSELALYAGRNATEDGQGMPLRPSVDHALGTITVGTLTYGANADSAPANHTLDATPATGRALLGRIDVGTLRIDLAGGAAGVFANDPDNKIGTFETVGTGDLFRAIVNDGDGDLSVKLASANSTADEVRIVTPGTLTLQTGTSLSFAAQTDVVLASTGGAFVNNAGAGAIGANGRFLIYSNAPETTAKGGLDGADVLDVFNHPYNATDTFADTTSRFLFSAASGGAPTLVYRADDLTRVYGDANPTLTFGVTGWQSGVPDDVTGAPSLSLGAVTQTSGVGSYPITIGQGTLDSGNYAFSFANGTLSITPAPLVITPNDASRLYGDANPSFSASFAGLKNGESGASVVSGLTLSTSATSASDAGSYAITASGASADNYSISYGGSGTLTVDKAPLTVAASNALKKTYGDANPNLFVGLTTSGLRNGDSIDQAVADLNFTTTATTSSPVGTYAVTGSGTSTNYDVTFESGLLTISKALLTIAADNATRLYGDANPAFTSTIAGLRNGDSPSIVSGIMLSTTATPASHVGTYAITASGATVAGGNYDVAYTPGTLTVNPASLTATIANATRAYGATNPEFSATFNGFKNGDTAAAISGLSLSTTATTGSNVGTYAINGTASASSNYALTFVPGTLTIDPAVLTLTPRALAPFVYGDTTAPGFGFDVSGFVNGDRLENFNAFGIAYHHGVTSSSAAGSYEVTMSGGSMRNYTIVHQPGTLVVQKAPLTVVPDSFTRMYGAENPAFTATYTGLRNGDTAESVASGITFITAAGVRSSVATYAINAQGSAQNYDLTFGVGSLTITPALLTVTPNPVTTPFGDALPAYTFSTSGWVAGDTPQAISGVTFNGPAASVTTSAPASYSLAIANPGTAPSANYTTVAGAPSTVTVTRRTVEVKGTDMEVPVGTNAIASVAATIENLPAAGPQFTAVGSASADEVKTAQLTHSALVVTPDIVPAAGTTRTEIDSYYDIKVTPSTVSFLNDVVFLDPGQVQLTTMVVTLTETLDPVTIDPELVKQPEEVKVATPRHAANGVPWMFHSDFTSLMGEDREWFASRIAAELQGVTGLSDKTLAALEAFAMDGSRWNDVMASYAEDATLRAALMPLFTEYAMTLFGRTGPLTEKQTLFLETLGARVNAAKAEIAMTAYDNYIAYQIEENERRSQEGLNALVLGARGLFGPPSDWSLKEKDIAAESIEEVLAHRLANAGAALAGVGAGFVLSTEAVTHKIFPNAQAKSALQRKMERNADGLPKNDGKGITKGLLKGLKATGVGAIPAVALEAITETVFIIIDHAEGEKNLAKYKQLLDEGKAAKEAGKVAVTDIRALYGNSLDDTKRAEMLLALMETFAAAESGRAGLQDTFRIDSVNILPTNG